MRPGESFIGQPIRSLQTMLQVIAENDSSHPALIPDGIYGPDTVKAVSVFQRKHGLPVTGVTDLATWEAIHAVYAPALVEQGQACPLYILLNPGRVIRRGERSPYVLLSQAMLVSLAEIYSSIGMPTHSGILDNPTADSLMSFQQLSRLPMTGNLDKHTWKHLALQYPLAVSRIERKQPGK